MLGGGVANYDEALANPLPKLPELLTLRNGRKVTMAFERRFAVVLVGSSGEGGAKPHRRNFGEAVENLTGSGQYHWMAGNFCSGCSAPRTWDDRTTT